MTATPIIPWIGGKRRLARHLLPMFPEHHCYVELFAGAAALFWAKEPAEVEVLNDVNGELVNLYRVVKHHLDELLRQFRWALSSRTMYKWLQATPEETLTDVQRAARFFYLQKLGFGGRVTSRSFGTATTAPPRLNLMTLGEDLSEAHLRLSRAFIEHLDWRECLRRYDRPHSFFYLDPPYWATEGYGVPFELEQYEAIAEAMRTMQGKAVLSINDCPEMRRVFAGFQRARVGIKYQVGGGRRNSKASGELIIRSWG